MNAICVYLGLFRRWKPHALHSTSIMQEKGVKTSKYIKWERNKSSFSSKSGNECELCVSGIVSTLETACAAFHKYNAVKRAFKRRNISNGREIKLNFRQNRQMITICVYMRLFRRWKPRALHSTSIMQ